MNDFSTLPSRINGQVRQRAREARLRTAENISEHLKDSLPEEAVQTYSSGTLEIIDVIASPTFFEDVGQIVRNALPSK